MTVPKLKSSAPGHLRSDNMLRMRIPTDAARAASHELGQKWSRAYLGYGLQPVRLCSLWLHDEKPDGIIYDSRFHGETNVRACCSHCVFDPSGAQHFETCSTAKATAFLQKELVDRPRVSVQSLK